MLIRSSGQFQTFFFFYEKILHAQKVQNAYEQAKIKKAAFLCAEETSKGGKFACSLI